VEKALLLDMLPLAEFSSGLALLSITLRAARRLAGHMIKIIREAIDNSQPKRGCLKYRRIFFSLCMCSL